MDNTPVLKTTYAHGQQMQDAVAAIRTAMNAGRGLAHHEGQIIQDALHAGELRLTALNKAIRSLEGKQQTGG